MPASEASVQGGPLSLLQAEGRTCEDFQDEDHDVSSPDSSPSPFDGELSTTSSSVSVSVSVDSLTTEGKGEDRRGEALGRGHRPGAAPSLTGIISGNKNCPLLSDEGPEAQRARVTCC